VFSTAISVVGRTIQTRFGIGYSTFRVIGVDFGEHGSAGINITAPSMFAHDDVLPRDIVDVFPYIALNCLCASVRSTHPPRVEHAVVFSRGNSSPPSPTRGRRKAQRAVDAHAVGKRVLQLERRGRQHVPHQGFELHLAKARANACRPEAPAG